MGKTTNILDLNNRLEKVEKKNVAQNNYNSLKNRPKINGNLLTGDKTGSQLGLAEAQEVGNLSDLSTTDKSSCVGAINEVVSDISDIRSAVYLGGVENITREAKTFSISEDFNNFVLLIFTFGTYGNVQESMTVPTSYFNATNTGKRLILTASQLNSRLNFCKDTNTTITVQGETTIESYCKLTVYGVIRK